MIEVSIASGILLCGLVAVAATFSFVIRTNAANRQMAVATSLLYDKMEEIRAAPFTDPIFMNAVGSETRVIAGQRYIRTWQIEANVPRMVTVVVYAENNALTSHQTELIRASTLVSPTF